MTMQAITESMVRGSGMRPSPRHVTALVAPLLASFGASQRAELLSPDCALHTMLEAARGLSDLLKARREAMEARWRVEMAARLGG